MTLSDKTYDALPLNMLARKPIHTIGNEGVGNECIKPACRRYCVFINICLYNIDIWSYIYTAQETLEGKSFKCD